MKTIKVKIDDLKEYDNNPRLNDVAIESVIKSIEQFGYVKPILIDKDNVIIAGHTRFKALKKLGFEFVECIVSALPNEKVREFRIVDNKVFEQGKWNKKMLLSEVREMNNKYFLDLLKQTGIKVATIKGVKLVNSKEIDRMNTKLEHKYDEDDIEYITLKCKKCGSDVTLIK